MKSQAGSGLQRWRRPALRNLRPGARFPRRTWAGARLPPPAVALSSSTCNLPRQTVRAVSGCFLFLQILDQSFISVSCLPLVLGPRRWDQRPAHCTLHHPLGRPSSRQGSPWILSSLAECNKGVNICDFFIPVVRHGGSALQFFTVTDVYFDNGGYRLSVAHSKPRPHIPLARPDGL